MIKNKITILLIFLIFFSTNIFSYTITGIDIVEEYTNDDSSAFQITLTATGEEAVIPLRINSTKQGTFIDFNAIKSGVNYVASFYIDLTSSASSTQSGWPKIIVNNSDVVTVSHVSPNLEDTLTVDTISPTIGTFDLISLGSKITFLEVDFYKGDINASVSGFSDSQTSLSEYIVYIGSSNDTFLNNYKTNYVKKINSSSSSSLINLDILNSNPSLSGSYYILIDAEDVAGNSGSETVVKANKKLVSIDNDPPEVLSFNLGTYQDDGIYYTPTSNFLISLVFGNASYDINLDDSIISVLDPDNVLFNQYRDYNTTMHGFYVPISQEFTTGTYKVSFLIKDWLSNTYESDFNIVIDSTPPTTPTVATVTRAIDNNITITNWGTSTDAGSGLKEYKIYRSTSSFTTITNQTLVCTLLSTATKTCTDTSSKSDNTTYYYGVSAIDNAGNKSLVVPVSVKTGPSLSVDIDFEYSNYVKTTTPEFNLEYGSDVNVVRFSCNGTSFTSWIDVSGTSLDYSSFNITSGNGCSTTQGEKTIYVEAKSEDSPYLVTRKDIDLKYDSQVPTTPSNVSLQEQTDGSVKITWTESTDAGSGIKEYRVYYSELDNITSTSPYFTTTDKYYTYKPNVDGTFYFKVSAIDKILNESALSAVVSGDTERYGPSFTFNVSPKNEINNIIYLKKGISNFIITSNQELNQNRILKLFKENTLLLQLGSTVLDYENLKINFDYNFTIDGNYTLEFTAGNISNQTSTDSFEFLVDVNEPVFDLNYSQEENLFSFFISNFSQDLFRVQYLLNNTDEICFLEEVADYNCSFDSLTYQDASYVMHVVVYDKALNTTTKTINFEVDNIDEAQVLKDTIISEISLNRKYIDDRLLFLSSISLDVSQEVIDKFNLAKEKIIEADTFQDSNNYVLAIENYTLANNLLSEIIESLPKENIVKTKTIEIDINNISYDLKTIILDQNILQDNLAFYDVNNTNLSLIKVTREFSVFEIYNQNYYSSVLNFDNNTNSDLIISYVEKVPKDFSKYSENIYFERDVVIIDDDPIVLYNITIPKNSRVSTKYISKEPITSFDILTKYDAIVYEDGLLLVGFVSKEDLNFSEPLFNKNFLFLIIIILVVIVIIMLIIWVVVSSKNKKEEVFKKIDAKDSMNKYLGDKIDENDISEQNLHPKSEIEQKNSFDSNYDFILNAVKRENKK